MTLSLREWAACRLVAEEDPWADRIDFLMEVMVSTYERRRFQTEVINELPLYPTESILWDENQVPDVHYTGKLLFLPSEGLGKHSSSFAV